MVSSKNVTVSQKRCLGTSIESFTGFSLSERIISGGSIKGMSGVLRYIALSLYFFCLALNPVLTKHMYC